MATNSLTGAICQAFAGNTALVNYFKTADGLAGCWSGEAAEDKVLPYTIVNVTGGGTEWDSGGFGIETSNVEFLVIAETQVVAENGAQLLMGVFDAVPSVISFDTYLLMAFLRKSPKKPEPVEQRSKQGEIVYQVTVLYDAMVQVQR